MSGWMIYWILKLDVICNLFGVIGVFGSLAGVGVIIFAYFNYLIHETCGKSNSSYELADAESAKNRYLIAKKLFPVSIIMFVILTISIFIPTTKEMATIIVAPKIINSEQMQQMPEKLLELGNAQLDKWIKDAKND